MLGWDLLEPTNITNVVRTLERDMSENIRPLLVVASEKHEQSHNDGLGTASHLQLATRRTCHAPLQRRHGTTSNGDSAGRVFGYPSHPLPKVGKAHPFSYVRESTAHCAPRAVSGSASAPAEPWGPGMMLSDGSRRARRADLTLLLCAEGGLVRSLEVPSHSTSPRLLRKRTVPY